MRRIFILLAFVLLFSVSLYAQDIRAISGGQRSEVDPKDKKSFILHADTEGFKLTLSKSHFWKHKRARVIAIYLKVENLSDKPLNIQPTRFHAVDATGQGYTGLDTSEAIKRFNETHAMTTTILLGPFGGPAAQQGTSNAITRESFVAGDIPPRSFKEGMIFFEGPKEQKYTLKISLGELWSEPFIFSTEKQKK